jgi:eukaryotic-like serine/threonine-protein kinase
MADGIPFGPYRLQRRLARGGMAEVFLARHLGAEGFERRVAIKRILPHLSDSEEFRSMFLDEARLAAQLTHPNVVHIYDFGRAGDYDFIAMEFVDGVDIGQLIRRGRKHPVPFELAARVLADVTGALGYAHRMSDAQGRPLKLVHRDVSPQNVLVSYDGVVKLVDFGIAKAAFAAGRTRPGVVKGKYAYMSPEQVEGKTLDGRSDVFSAGICLYELVTGVPLFRRDDVTASMREIRDGKPIVPERYRPDVPDALVAIMRRALARSRDDRYADAEAMQAELERYLKSADALATSSELGAYLRRELPPAAQDDGAEATGQQEQGTEAQAGGTEKQPRAATEPEPRAESESQAITLEEEDAQTEEREGPTNVRQPLPAAPFDRPYSGTSLVPPLPQANRRAYVAAAVAAFTVAAIGILVLRPWRSQAANPVIVVERPLPAPPDPVTQPLATPQALQRVEPPTPPLTLLDLDSHPRRATVYVDNRLLSAVTPVVNQGVPPGLHHITVARAGFLPRHLTLELDAGEHRTLDVELRAAPKHRGKTPHAPTGTLTVRTVPWSKVYDGSRLVGTTPLANVALTAGSHSLRFVNPDLPPVKRTVEVRAGEETRLSLEIK